MTQPNKKECKHEWTGINTETNRVVCSVCFIPMPIEAEKGLDWEVVLKLGDICLGTIIDEGVGEPIWKMPRDKMYSFIRQELLRAEQAAEKRILQTNGLKLKELWQEQAKQERTREVVAILLGMKKEGYMEYMRTKEKHDERMYYNLALSEAIKAIESNTKK